MNIRDFADFIKVRQTLMAVLTGVIAYAKASNLNIDPLVFMLVTASLFLTVAGSTGFNMLFDMDIDSIMSRTKHRPLPSGRMTQFQALSLSTATVLLGLLLAALVKLWVLLFGVLGFLIFSFLYTKVMKRRTPWSVIVCGSAGAMPVLGGWAAATGKPSVEAVLLGALVVLWSYLHIWTAATYYSDDYRRAGVPMLPVVMGERAGVTASSVVLLLVLADAFLLHFYHVYSAPSIAVLTVMASVIMAVLLRGLASSEYKRSSYVAWKLATAYIALAFLLLFF
ncbi:protoheme IX farnesyltransferase [Infirmifilum lucidum]|uniref:Protoheme IX farnesyltransferase n=1 Tax=Infirmifilum lucidum TaxID=2776706 RepID=A0A7L9FII0_9CREN|nr:protoheme IX farnesyltransferase [Infirmifilum lucidum]QOJ78734.1 protoheme IX farnesyltransferase [Infirmifilum lucidum]